MKIVTAKYVKAISQLKARQCPLTHVAREFGLHPETFR